MRAFLAVEIPAALRAALAQAVRALAPRMLGWRFARGEGIHLTLRFLGDAAPEAIERGAPLWRDAAREVAPFTILVAGLGVFPNARRPRVLWARVIEEPDEGRLLALARGLERGCVAGGLPRSDRDFAPHLTLARAAGRRACVPPSGAGEEYGRVPVSEVVLFRSDLHALGAVHTPLERFRLGSGGR